tara:strand:- start:67761 stop:68624 length:864 start_codon:yes stop_codon:yes gene_type:complete
VNAATIVPPTGPGGPVNQPDFASILIVDDQRFDRMRLRRLCGDLEFETHIAEAESLAAMTRSLNGEKFDLILLDYNMPDGNGLQALEMIRSHASNGHAAVIMITGSEQNAVAIQALKNGCSDFITKDELSPAALCRSAINALQKSTLQIGMETQDQKRQQMEKVLQQFSKECAQEIKPVVSRMLRQMRDMREHEPKDSEELADQVGRIERSCMRLWEFLDDLGSYRGSDLAQENFAQTTVADALDIAPRRGPAQSPQMAPAAHEPAPTPRSLKKSATKRPTLFGPRE